MDKTAILIDALKRFKQPAGDIFAYAEVTEITGDTCSVKIGELKLTDVRMKATDDGAADKLVVIPKVGTKVIVGANNGDLRDLFLIKVDDPEIMIYTHGNVVIEINGKDGEVKFDKAKYTIKNDQEDLKTLLNDLVTAITKLTVTTGTGPSGVPINLTDFTDILQRLPKLFK